MIAYSNGFGSPSTLLSSSYMFVHSEMLNMAQSVGGDGNRPAFSASRRDACMRVWVFVLLQSYASLRDAAG